MAVKRLFQIRPQYDDGNGALASSYRLFFYAAGSSTKQNTYNSSTGSIANSNPIVLNALGEPAVEVWGTVGQTYKIGFAIPGTDDPPASFVWTEDNIAPINDSTVTLDQWVSGQTPTFVSATQFTLVGDQTSTFHVGRRVKTTNSGGTIYSTITVSAFGALTTVTVVNDSGVLDSGLSAVSYSLLSTTNPAVPGMSTIRNASGIEQIALGVTTLAFKTSAAESFRVDSSQRVLIGHTAQVGRLGELLEVTNSAAYGGAAFTTFSTGAEHPILDFNKSMSNTKGTQTVVTSGAVLGFLGFRGSDGTGFIEGATIQVQVDGTPGANDMPGRIMFFTTPDGSATPSERLRIDNAGNLYINDTSNANQTLGLTINQGGNLTKEVLCFKGTGVAHGITSATETDTYGLMTTAAGGANAGLKIAGYSSGTNGLNLIGVHTTDDTTKSSSAAAAIRIDAQLKSGTSITNPGANANMVVFNSLGSGGAKFILDADGDSHQDVGTAWTNFDAFDDVALLDALSVEVSRDDDPIKREFGAFLKYNREMIEKAKLVTFNEDGHHFVNMSKLTMAHTGAIRQLGAALEKTQQRLVETEGRLQALMQPRG